MIEVEKKFILNEQDEERLIEGAEFLSEKMFTDVYYDTTDFGLTTRDKWLRSRDGRWELKLPLGEGASRVADQYDELESEAEIRQALGLAGENLEIDLQVAGYAPFCRFTTTRRKYRKGNFVIDLDAVDFGSFKYAVGEIELMVNDKSEMDVAIEKIVQFARDNGLVVAPVRGKVIEYVKRMSPQHYQAMVDAGVVKDY